MTDLKYELHRSKRKTVSVEISREARIIVRAPLKMPLRDIDAFLQSKSSWITEHLERVKSTIAQIPPNLSDRELSELRKRAKEEIPTRVSLYASLMGVEYGKITVRTQKTRFGSCSSKGNLNTYTYYQKNVKPKPAPEKKKGYVCKICGYVYEGDPLPEDFVCPWCKHPASDFEPIK